MSETRQRTDSAVSGRLSAKAPLSQGTRGSRKKLKRSRNRAGWALVGPAMLVLSLVMLLPIGYGFYLSLTSYNPVERGAPKFHGFTGYLKVLQSSVFWDAVWVTFLYAAGTLLIAVPVAMLLAVLVNGNFPGVGIFRAVLYLPRVVPLVAAALIWMWLYSHDGFFNYVLDIFGLPGVDFLTNENTALLSLILMRSWKALGGGMILFLAGLQSVPSSLLESASVDGCGRMRRFWHVTLPTLVPITTYVIVMDLIYLAQSFTEIYIMTSGGPLSSTKVVNMLVYEEAFQHYRLGDASAMAFVLFCLIFAVAYANIRILRRR